ncbi:hypothetical protein [Polaromonas sp. P5_D5]
MTSSKSAAARQNTLEQPVSGKGMPAKTPRVQSSRPEQAGSPKDTSVEASLGLPHERDQSVDMTGGQSSAEVEQAGRDLRRGLKDTSKGPEMGRAYKKLKS